MIVLEERRAQRFVIPQLIKIAVAVVNEFAGERGIARRALPDLIHSVKRVVHVFRNEPVAVYDGIEPAVLIVDVGGE